MNPKYPVYVISKGRSDHCLTAKFLIKDDVPFKIVVEPQERDLYAKEFGIDRLLVLPFSNLGLGSIPARNWVWQHAKATGVKRHWIVDDNIRNVVRFWKGKKISCDSGPALACIEDFADRFSNVALAGPNYRFFATTSSKAFTLNTRVYSCILILNELPYIWRGRYNEDTDLTLQALAGNWCTILANVFLIDKMTTMSMKGGNTTELYKNDGRLEMARELERRWPGVVRVDRRWNRPQHVVDFKKFKNNLVYIEGFNLDNLPKKNEYGLHLKQIAPIQSDYLRELVKDNL